MRRYLIKNDFKFWRKLMNTWSFLFFALAILDFLARNAHQAILNVVATIYISILAVYVSNKEFERWYDRHETNHPGEIFVIIWSILVICLLILDFIYTPSYQVPNAVISSYIAVLTILVITRKSKQLYQRRRRRA